MTDERLPFVSVLMPAYNYERFVAEALHSALAQDYPADRFEVIVVDDGSTDDTSAVVSAIAATNPGRLRLLRQANSGQIRTVQRARAAARGDLIALLDADDVWLPGKLRRQVEVFVRDPEVGLVFCDMHTIDGDGQVIKRTVYEPHEFDPEHVYARVLRSNVVYNSSLIVRPDLFVDPPDTVCDWDWWIALRAGERSRIEYLAEPLAQYRLHGDNMLFGAAGPKLVELRRRQLRFQLWSLRHMRLDQLSMAELLDVWRGAEWFVMTAAQSTGSYFQALVSISDDERTEALKLRADAQAAWVAGDLVAAARLRLRALAWNPYESDGLSLLQAAAAAAEAAERAPHPLAGSRAFVVLADAQELLRDESMLRSYAEAMANVRNVTLAIDATAAADADIVSQLQSLIARSGLADNDEIDLLAVVDARDAAQRLRMYRDADALYTRAPGPREGLPRLAPLPTFAPQDLAELSTLAATG